MSRLQWSGVSALAVGLLALDEGVAEEDDAVAVAEFKARRGRGGAGGGEGEENEQGGAEDWAHRGKEGVVETGRRFSQQRIPSKVLFRLAVSQPADRAQLTSFKRSCRPVVG